MPFRPFTRFSVIITITGNRPQLVKCFPVSSALRQAGLKEQIIYTWQHYDEGLFENLYRELGFSWNADIPGVNKKPKGLHALFQNIEKQAAANNSIPQAVLVYGDTDSTLAGALFAKKNNIPLVHIEAGERSFNPAMPEEMNRTVTDRLSDLLFCVNEKAAAHLAGEGIQEHVIVAGDVMLDALLLIKGAIETGAVAVNPLLKVYNPGSFIYFTLHREANTGHAGIFNAILNAVGALHLPVLWPVHPRCTELLKHCPLPANIILLPPVGYADSIWLLQNCSMAVTDSGGLQKEAWWLKKKCITLRGETEWTETLAGNCNMLEYTFEPEVLRQKAAVVPDWSRWSLQSFGGGTAAAAIAAHLKDYCRNT